MKNKIKLIFIIAICMIIASCQQKQQKNEPNHQEKQTDVKEITKHEPVQINTADEAITELKSGNQRFLEGKLVNTDYKTQIEHTKKEQHPHTVVLSCLDSRVPPEIIFDQGIGNLFVARVAGNIEDLNIIGSMEYAVKVKGTKLIVIMGHNHCGAVKGAIDDVKLGHLTQLVEQIKPAIVGDKTHIEEMSDETAKKNIQITIDDIQKNSQIISSFIKEKKIKIIGAFYDLTSGKVTFME